MSDVAESYNKTWERESVQGLILNLRMCKKKIIIKCSSRLDEKNTLYSHDYTKMYTVHQPEWLKEELEE